MAWPAAGPSTTMTSQSPLRSSCLILPSTTMSSMPGRRRGDDVDHAGRRQPLGDPPEAVLAQVLLERRRRRDAARTAGRRRGRRAPACRRARRRARAGRRRRPRGRERPLPWSCRHPPCRPPSSRARRSAAALDRRAPEAPLRRLAIALLSAAAGVAVLAAGGGSRPAPRSRSDPGPVDVLQVSGLFDPIVVDADRRRPSTARPTTAPRRSSCRSTRGAPSSAATRSRRCWSASTPRRCRSPSGSARPAPASTARPAQLLAVADVSGMAPGARVGHTGVPLRPNGDAGRLRRGADELARRARSGLSDARRLGVFEQRISDEGIPTIASMVDALDGYARGRRRRSRRPRSGCSTTATSAGTRRRSCASPSSASSTSCSTPSPARPSPTCCC